MSTPHMRWGFPFRVLTDKTLSVSFNISIYNFYKNCNTFSKFLSIQLQKLLFGGNMFERYEK